MQRDCKYLIYLHYTIGDTEVTLSDVLAVFNILHGRYDIDLLDFFTFSHNIHQTRGHLLKLYKHYSRTDIRKNFFTRGAINPWNNLPKEVISTSSTNNFKNLIDYYALNNMYTSD